ncbi:hypothetical protein DSO57_1035795 [Entomophthora muscae]|uniref:Uncharacterized protein n=1 Tax=Entomophthora muscae TaxID=34485 RepID=A0ACC2S1P2_9FUNG|nr:hypothetical protein DSO57_1035795 [Entomophthora muscae]
MELPTTVIEETVKYLEPADLYEMRLLDRIWNLFISKRIFHNLHVRRSYPRKEYITTFERYGKECRILTISELQHSQAHFTHAASDFQLLPHVHSLRLVDVKRVPFSLSKACQELKHLRHLSIFGVMARLKLKELYPISSQLTSIFLYNTYHDFPGLREMCFPCLKALTYNTRENTIALPRNITKSFPALVNLHIYVRINSLDYSLLDIDWQAKQIRSIGAHYAFCGALVSYDFAAAKCCFSSEAVLKEKYSIFKAALVLTLTGQLYQYLPPIRGFSILNNGTSFHAAIESMVAMETISIQIDERTKVSLPKTTFTAKEVELILTGAIYTGLLSWLCEYFPSLSVLKITTSIAGHRWKGSLCCLEYLYTPTSCLTTLVKIIANSPKIKHIDASFDLPQLLYLRGMYPHMTFSSYRQQTRNFEQSYLGC